MPAVGLIRSGQGQLGVGSKSGKPAGREPDQLWGCPNALESFPLVRPTSLRHWIFSNSQSHGCTPFCFRGPGLRLIRHHS